MSSGADGPIRNGPSIPKRSRSRTIWRGLAHKGKNEEAEKLFRETAELETRVLGPEHRRTIGAVRSLAFLLHNEGRNAEAEKLRRQVLQSPRRVFGPDHPFTLATMGALAIVLESQEKLNETNKLHSERLAIAARKPGSRNWPTHNLTHKMIGSIRLPRTLAVLEVVDFTCDTSKR